MKVSLDVAAVAFGLSKASALMHIEAQGGVGGVSVAADGYISLDRKLVLPEVLGGLGSKFGLGVLQYHHDALADEGRSPASLGEWLEADGRFAAAMMRLERNGVQVCPMPHAERRYLAACGCDDAEIAERMEEPRSEALQVRVMLHAVAELARA